MWRDVEVNNTSRVARRTLTWGHGVSNETSQHCTSDEVILVKAFEKLDLIMQDHMECTVITRSCGPSVSSQPDTKRMPRWKQLGVTLPTGPHGSQQPDRRLFCIEAKEYQGACMTNSSAGAQRPKVGKTIFCDMRRSPLTCDLNESWVQTSHGTKRRNSARAYPMR